MQLIATSFAILAVLLMLAGASCVRISGGTWMISEAKLPEGWPEATPVGTVEVRQYPAYRAARVLEDDLSGSGQGSMFNELFKHIKDKQVPMTAPVEMGLEGDGDRMRMVSMAFLYPSTARGQPATEGTVVVKDFEPETMASVGVRGSYDEGLLGKPLTALHEWLERNADQWQVVGPPRFLGYNSPFVPSFMRYGELQVPIHPIQADSQVTSSD